MTAPTTPAGRVAAVHLGWARLRDLPAIVRVERDSFDHAWTGDDFRRVLARRDVHGKVAEVRGRVVGFMVYELHMKRLHLLNFAVAPLERRCGVGTRLAAALVAGLATHRRDRVTLVVRDGNLAAHSFFAACGFRAVRVLPGYYAGTAEDGYLMTRRADGAADAFQPRSAR